MTHSLVHSLPPLVRRKMGMKLGEMQVLKDSGMMGFFLFVCFVWVFDKLNVTYL
jgi:hypothetical protein